MSLPSYAYFLINKAGTNPICPAHLFQSLFKLVIHLNADEQIMWNIKLNFILFLPVKALGRLTIGRWINKTGKLHSSVPASSFHLEMLLHKVYSYSLHRWKHCKWILSTFTKRKMVLKPSWLTNQGNIVISLYHLIFSQQPTQPLGRLYIILEWPFMPKKNFSQISRIQGLT